MSTLRDLLYQAVDGSFAIDAKQRIIYWDSGCEELLGYTAHWALGRPCCDVLQGCKPGTDIRFCQQECCVAKLSDNGPGPKTFPLEIKDRNDKSLIFSVSIILVPSACKDSWHIMHLLYKGIYPDVLSAMNNVSKKHSRLTARETEVLNLLSEGMSSSVIAQHLCISNTTVRNHIQHIHGKLGVHSQTEAVAYAYRHHFL